MNYIEYLNNIFDVWDQDDRINVYHRSVFMQLFRKWNDSFWAQEMIISSKEITDALNISRSSYTKAINQLDDWGYIRYNLSIGRQVGGKVVMLPIDAIKMSCANHNTDENFCRPSIDRTSFLSFSFFEASHQPVKSEDENEKNIDQKNDQKSSHFDPNIEKPPACEKSNPCVSEKHPLRARQAAAACETRSHKRINYKQENNINITEREIIISYSTGKAKNNPGQSPPPSKKINFVFSISNVDSINQKKSDRRPYRPISSRQSASPAESFANGFSPPSRQLTAKLFADLRFPEKEADKFFNYYEKKGWTVGHGAPMTNLQAAIRSWMDRHREFSIKEGRSSKPSIPKDYYHVHNNNSKNYAQPL